MQICVYPTKSLVADIPIDKSTPTTGEIAGLVISSLVWLFCCSGVAFMVWRKRKDDKEAEEDIGSIHEMIKGVG